jgi:N-acetyltransferase
MASNTCNKKQMLLDFGQKSSGIKRCVECEMEYNNMDADDSMLHSKYHKQKDSLLKFNGWKNEKIVNEYIEGRCIVIENGIDPNALVTKANKILEYVDIELGIRNANQILTETDHSKRAKTEIQKCQQQVKYYLFIKSNRIIGFCMAESISHAYKARYETDGKLVIDTNKENSVHALCGISRIWVDKNHRRKKIASKLVDCVCLNFLYFESVPSSKLAFSDPTEFGKKLASAYCSTDEFLIYTEN